MTRPANHPKGRSGYGRFGIDGRVILAHRFAYETLVEPIPEGMTIDHLCRVHRCVNPAHLEAVTQSENIRRALPFRKAKPLRTRCAQDHELNEATSYPRSDGVLRCRICIAERVAARSEERRQRRIAELGYDPGPRSRAHVNQDAARIQGQAIGT